MSMRMREWERLTVQTWPWSVECSALLVLHFSPCYSINVDDVQICEVQVDIGLVVDAEIGRTFATALSVVAIGCKAVFSCDGVEWDAEESADLWYAGQPEK